MAPFARKAACAVDQLAINDEAAANAGAQDHAKDDTMATPGADAGFCQNKTIGIIGNDDGKPSSRSRSACSGRRARRGYWQPRHSTCRIDYAGDRQRDAIGALAGLFFRLGDEGR